MKLRQDRKGIRQKEAQERQEEYNKLTPQQKIDRLDKKLGKGKGETKQRKKLQALIKTEKPKQKATKKKVAKKTTKKS